jgi:hypothetical protein
MLQKLDFWSSYNTLYFSIMVEELKELNIYIYNFYL